MKIDLKRLDALSEETPVLVDLKPTGDGYMEDFHAAGGMVALMRELRDLLHLDTIDLYGKTLAEQIDAGTPYVDRTYIRARATPVSPVGGIVSLFGSLAPDGAILKRSAATPALFETEARCVVFDGLADLAERIDSDDLDVTATDILVLKNAGPLTPAGMPEAGYLPIPKKLARQGVKDMVRMSDCRMSGTAFGTIVLHIAPEAAAGGPLALIETGDRVRLSVRSAGWTCWWRRPSWPAAAPSGRPRRRRSAAGTSWCTSRCCRRRKAPTSLSCGPRDAEWPPEGSPPLRLAARPLHPRRLPPIALP